MSSANSTVPAGWYRDPAGGAHERYFDGAAWSAETRAVTLRPRTPPAPAPARSAAPTAMTPPAQLPAATVFGIDPTTGLPAFPGAATPAREAWPAGSLAASDPVGAGSVPSGSAVEPAGTTGSERARRSLAQAIAEPVDSLAAQRFLLGDAALALPSWLTDAPTSSPAGWYPDPARSGGLRFFDGTRWTARSRPAVDEGIRRLPAAALRLRAAFLEAQDAAALRRGERPRPERVRIARARGLPSLAARSHQSSSIVAMLATLVVVAALAVAGYLGWQLWGSDWWNVRQQAQLEQELESSPGTGWGEVPVVIEHVPDEGADPGSPMPTATSLPSATATRPSAQPTTRPAPKPTTNRPPVAAPRPTAPSRPRATTDRVTIAPNTTADGKPVGHIRIPRIGLDRVFVLGTEAEQLAMGPGLWKWGVFPGTPGNSTISGHRGGHGAPFRYLNRLKYGDQIIIDVPGQPQAVFEVRGRTIADPFDVQVTRQTAGVRLTLTTCHPVGGDAERMVVEAELVAGKYLNQAVSRSKWKLLT